MIKGIFYKSPIDNKSISTYIIYYNIISYKENNKNIIFVGMTNRFTLDNIT